MTSTSHMRHHQEQQIDTWSRVFPAELNTPLESEVFVKKLLIVGLSSITYLRTIFPESSYAEQHLEGLKLKLLVDRTYCVSSNTVVSWIRSCFQALERKYLRQLTFAILNKKNRQEAFETYTYKFRYTEEGPVLSGPGAPNSAISSINIRQSTEKMLRTIILLTQNMGPLPKTVCLSMKLGYYDDVTPSDYEPPHFGPVAEESYSFPSKPFTIKVGSVATRFHSMKMYVCVEQSAYPTGDLSPAEKDEEVQQEELLQPGDECTDVVRSVSRCDPRLRHTLSGRGLHAAGSIQGRPLSQSSKDDHQVPTQSSISYGTVPSQNGGALTTQEELMKAEEESQPLSNTESEGYPVRCPCGVSCDHGLMILCDICQKWQHGACFNVLEESELQSHVCEECASPTHPCTDPSLLLKPEMVKFCLFRRALVLLEQMKTRITAATLAQQLGVDISMGTHLLRELMKEKVLYVRKKLNRVNRVKLLCVAFPKFLKQIKNSTESQGTVDLTSPDKKKLESQSNFDLDTTPDLDLPSLHESTPRRQAQGRDSDTLDETLDVFNITEDIPVGTQVCQEPSQGETCSEALATAGNTLLLLDTPSEPSQGGSKRYSTSMRLHSGVDEEEASELMETQESLGTPTPACAPPLKTSIRTRSRRGRGRGHARRRTMSVNNFVVSSSQESDLHSRNSISQDSEIFKPRKRVRK